jgi:alcohol dehydrogenase (cytochrome c)
LYRSEHWGMDGFNYKLPNGKYIVKLHFAETYDGITGPGDRVFSLQVQGKDLPDFDVWKKAGGPRTAYIETVPVEVTDGQLKITFIANADSPEINGIEILPADKGTNSVGPHAAKSASPAK